MRDNDKETTLTRVRRRSSWQAYQENGDEAVKQYTMFAIGAVTFLTGFWALACLANLFFQAVVFSAQ